MIFLLDFSEVSKAVQICTSCAVNFEYIDFKQKLFQILRADVIEDCGRSLNPYVDIGQIEGSIIMGYGLFTTEMVKYNPETGEKLSNGTWVSKLHEFKLTINIVI